MAYFGSFGVPWSGRGRASVANLLREFGCERIGQGQAGSDGLATQVQRADLPKQLAGAQVQPLGRFDDRQHPGAELIAPSCSRPPRRDRPGRP